MALFLGLCANADGNAQEKLVFSSGPDQVITLSADSVGEYSGYLTDLSGLFPRSIKLSASNASPGRIVLNYEDGIGGSGSLAYDKSIFSIPSPGGGQQTYANWTAVDGGKTPLPESFQGLILGTLADSRTTSDLIAKWKWTDSNLLSVKDLARLKALLREVKPDTADDAFSQYLAEYSSAGSLGLVTDKTGLAVVDALMNRRADGTGYAAQTLGTDQRLVVTGTPVLQALVDRTEVLTNGLGAADDSAEVKVALIAGGTYPISPSHGVLRKPPDEDERLKACVRFEVTAGIIIQCDFHSTKVGLPDQWWIRAQVALVPSPLADAEQVFPLTAVGVTMAFDDYDAAVPILDRLGQEGKPRGPQEARQKFAEIVQTNLSVRAAP